MKKRLISVFLMTVMVFAAAAGTAADTAIADSMEFQGDAMELSLAKAQELAMAHSSTLLQSQLDVANSKIEYDKYMDTMVGAKRGLPMAGYGTDSGQYIQAVTLIKMLANFTVDSAERNYKATINSVKADIEKSYYSLQQAQQMMEINHESMVASKDLYEKTKKKYELGMVAKQEVLSSELSYINSQNAYDTSINNYKAAKMALNTMLDNEVMTELKLTDELSYMEYTPIEVADAINAALSNRYEMKILEDSLEMAETKQNAAHKLYDDFNYNYRAADIEYQKAATAFKNGEKSIEMEIRINYMNLLQKKKEIESGQKSVELAQQGLTIAEATYDAGMAVMSDVEKAQTGLKQAKLGLSKAILDYNLAISAFEDSIGIGRKAAAAY